MLTRRFRYNETIDLVYASNTFDVGDELIALCFFATILPQRRHAIRSLQVDRVSDEKKFGIKGAKLWPLLSQMQGLRRLHIRVRSRIEPSNSVVLKHFNQIKERETGEYAIHYQN